MKKKETAEKVAAKFAARAWIKYSDEEKTAISVARVYFSNGGFAEITERGINIDKVKRANFDDVKKYAAEIGIATYRA